MNFPINLTQFYMNFSRQEHQIDVYYVSFNAWDSQVLSCTPFQFSFTVPLSFNFFRNTGFLRRVQPLGGCTIFFSNVHPTRLNLLYAPG